MNLLIHIEGYIGLRISAMVHEYKNYQVVNFMYGNARLGFPE